MFLYLRTRNAQHGGISVSQAVSHFKLLTKSVGLISAVRAAVSTLVQLFFREGGMIRRSRPEQLAKHPYIIGAPAFWNLTCRRAISLPEYLKEHGMHSSLLPDLIGEINDLAKQSGNDYEYADTTIVIPAYENRDELLGCLTSIFSFSTQRNFVILIADDCSPSCTFSSLASIKGVMVIRNQSNLGYIGNVNNAVLQTKTRFIVTLNQDTVVCPGWLDALIDELELSPTNGIAGPRLLDGNFDVLEAGGILHKEAHARHRGRGLHSEHPSVNYTTTVDYVSGCALAIKTELWVTLGGLCESLAPAYYDDVDLCLRARELGFDTRYVPQSCVVHLEGTSMGTDPNDPSSLKRFQIINREKVAERHKERLSLHTEYDLNPFFVSHFECRKTVVCILEEMPRPDRDGGSVDFALITEYLNELKFHVVVLFTRENTLKYSASWRRTGITCAAFDTEFGQSRLESCDLVFSFGSMVGLFLDGKIPIGKPWIHHTSDIATRRLKLMNELQSGDSSTSAEASRWFMGLPRDVDAMWKLERPTLEKPTTALIVSADDLQFSIENGASGNLVQFQILKGASKLKLEPKAPSDKTISFVGSMLHSPNPDAVDYFLRDMWPLIAQTSQDVRFLIWGSGIVDGLATRWSAHDRVEVRGWFANYDEVVAQTHVFVSPLRFGAGMKHKVVSSILFGRPVVGTPISFDGLHADLLDSGLSSNDPKVLVESLLGILDDNDKWLSAWKSCRAAVGDQFCREDEMLRLQSVIDNAFAACDTL